MDIHIIGEGIALSKCNRAFLTYVGFICLLLHPKTLFAMSDGQLFFSTKQKRAYADASSYYEATTSSNGKSDVVRNYEFYEGPTLNFSLNRDYLFARFGELGAKASDTYSDPTYGSFGLRGTATSFGISTYLDNTALGLTYRESSLRGSISGQQGRPNVTTVESRVQVNQRSVGIYLGSEITEEKSSASMLVGVSRHKQVFYIDDSVRAFLFGFPFPGGSSVVRDNNQISFDVWMKQDLYLGTGWRLGLSELYQASLTHPDSSGSQASISISLTKAIGVKDDVSKSAYGRSERNRCSALEAFGRRQFSNLTGSDTDNSVGRRYTINNQLGWTGHSNGLGYYFGGSGAGCHRMSLANTSLRINYHINNSASSRNIDTSIQTILSGHEIRYGYQFDVAEKGLFVSYIRPGLGLWFGEGHIRSKSQYLFDDTSSAMNDSPVSLLLLDMSVGVGFKRQIGVNTYMVCEVLTRRFDGRPFGRDARGWSNSLSYGLGYKF